jgi:hypothetical protein
MNQRDQNAPRARRSETNRRDPADPKDHGNQKNRRETWRTSRAKCRDVEIIRRKDRDGSAGRIAVADIISCLFWSLVRLARRAKTTAGEKKGGISFQRVVDVNTRDPGLVEVTIVACRRLNLKTLSTIKCAPCEIFVAGERAEMPFASSHGVSEKCLTPANAPRCRLPSSHRSWHVKYSSPERAKVGQSFSSTLRTLSFIV